MCVSASEEVKMRKPQEGKYKILVYFKEPFKRFGLFMIITSLFITLLPQLKTTKNK